jgi:hypothetical protein
LQRHVAGGGCSPVPAYPLRFSPATIRWARALWRRQIRWRAKWTRKRNTRSRCWR